MLPQIKEGICDMTNKTAISQSEISQHTLQMEQRRHSVITGVTDVCSFDENEVVLRVAEGTLVLTGEGLHIGKLLLDDGRLDIDGRVDSIVYETAAQPVGKWLSRWRKNR